MADRAAAESLRRLRVAMAALGLVGIAGTLGYVLIEHWSVLEALYMTVTTLTTVGFMEVRPLSDGGRLFTILLVIVGVGTFFYLAGNFAEYVIGGSLRGALMERRMEQRVGHMEGHHIVCGFGRVGEQVVRDLEQRGRAVVVVEHRPAAIERLGGDELYVVGDATDEKVLKEAGIDRAAGLVAATGEDTANIVITLTARALNPGLVIVSRADNEPNESKMLRAGATHVISPHRIGGRRIVGQLLNPRVTDFLDMVMHSGRLELLLEDVTLSAGCTLEGQTLGESGLRDELGVNVLAVSGPPAGTMVMTPPTTHRFKAGEALVVLGTREQLERLGRMAQG